MSGKVLKEFLFACLFLILVIGMGAVSAGKLALHYFNQETENNEWTPELGNRFETDIASTFYNKRGFVNLNGAIANLLKQPYMNEVVKLNNGYLMAQLPKTSDEELKRRADNTLEFKNYLEARGTHLVYAATPCSDSKYDSQLPAGIEDYGNDNTDRFLDYLRANGVDTIDYRQVMHDDGIDHFDMMYRTDHHWTTKAGLYAYGVLEDYITEKTGCEVDERIRDIDNYDVTTYEKWHLGSNGQRTGVYYAGIDDFDLIVPKFETSLKNSEGVTGSMPELMIKTDALETRDFTSRYTYDFVLKKTLGDYTNLSCKNDVKILFVSDSFGKAVAGYLAMGFKEIRYVYNLEAQAITRQDIEEYDPDVVVLLYYTHCLNDEAGAFEFNLE